MSEKKRAKIEQVVMKLLGEKSEISLHDIALTAGLSKTDEGDRKAIRRVINDLIGRGHMVAKGAARARVYARTAQVEANLMPVQELPGLFGDISLPSQAKVLLQYVSRPLQARIPVGYDQKFLRSYEPNQSFYLNPSQRAELLRLGQVEHKVRPAGTYARNILGRLLIDLSWNSSRLEGNTYSLLETRRLIELGESAEGKEAAEAQMILNHKGAIEYVIESAAERGISAHEVCSIHALLSENLLGDSAASGRLRQVIVGIAGTTYMPLENPHILAECFQVFIEKLNLIEDPFEQSLFALIQLSYMQAFEDVNKRTARIVANIPLVKKNLRPLSFADIDQNSYVKALIGVYEKQDIGLIRELYLWAYQRSSQKYSALQQAMGDPDLVFKLKYRKEIQEIIRFIVLKKMVGQNVVKQIKAMIGELGLPDAVAMELFEVIETEILNLHDGNIARYKIRPSEFQGWSVGSSKASVKNKE